MSAGGFDVITDADKERALSELVALNRTSLMRLCYMYLGDASLAEDAVQDTFFKAYLHMHTFRGECSHKTWLTRIAINTCKNMRLCAYMRRRKQHLPLDKVPEAGAEDEYSDDTLINEVMRMPARDKQVILLRYYQELTVSEVARALNIPVATASSRLRRAKLKLKEALKGWWFDE